MRRVAAQGRFILGIVTSLRGGEGGLTTHPGRAAERHRRVLLSALSSGVAWATSVATALVIVPVVLHYLGAERYGVFATITAIAAALVRMMHPSSDRLVDRSASILTFKCR